MLDLLLQLEDEDLVQLDEHDFRTRDFLSSIIENERKLFISIYLFRSTSNAGNKSPIKLRKIGASSVVIFGMLKSLNALINTLSSLMCGSALLNVPATTRTDLIALNPQS